MTTLLFLILSVAAVLIFYLWQENRRLRRENGQSARATGNIQERYEDSQFWMQALFQYSSDIICFKDAQGRWLAANPADLKLFHLEGVDYRGKTDSELADFTHPCYREAFLTCELTDRETWEKGEVVRAIEQIKGPDGELIQLDTLKIPLFDADHRPKGLLVIGRDVSQYIAVEKSLEDLKNAYWFSTRIRHEFIRAESKQALFQHLCQLIAQQPEIRLAWIGRKEWDKTQRIQPLAHAGEDAKSYLAQLHLNWKDQDARAQGPGGRAVRTGKIAFVQDIAEDPDFAPWREAALQRGYRAVVALPIRVFHKVWGVLVLYAGVLGHFNPILVQLLEHLVEDLGFGIEALQDRKRRRAIARSLEKANAFLHTVIDSFSHPFLVINARTHRVEIANQAAKRLHWNAQDGLTCYQLGHHREIPCDSGSEPCPLQQLMQTGKPVVVEHIHYDQEKRPHYVEIHAFPIREENGQIERFIEYSLDITERKQALEALERANREREVLLNTIPLGITYIRLKGKRWEIVWCNEAFCQMFRLSRDQVEGFSPRQFYVSEEDYIAIGKAAYSVLQAGGIYRGEHRVRRGDGTLFQCRILGRSLKMGDLSAGTLWMQEDITEEYELKQRWREARDQAESANRAKSAFLANMSHEIRTPMNVIIGMSKLALETDEDQMRVQLIEKVHHASTALLGIINDILDFSKIEAGKLKLEQVDFHLSEVIDDFIALIQPLAEQKQLQLHIDLDPNLPKVLRGDPLRLRQILINLGGNAVKFTSEGAVHFQVQQLAAEAGEARIAFNLRDTGIGMTEAQQQALFQAFSQADDSTSRRYGGTGLGLVICKRLVDLMGGEIEVNSTLNQGSLFRVTLAFPRGEPANLPESADRAEAAAVCLDGVRILLVEDNLLNQELALTLLRRRGAQVQIARHGEEALTRLAQADFDLVLMDIQMPILDGYEATKKIRAQARFQQLPILAMSANVLPSEQRRAKAVGMNDYIAKPLNEEKMFSTIARWLPRERHRNRETMEQATNPFRLETIPGLDAQQGMQIAGRNETLYRKLLGIFLETHKDFAPAFRAALEEEPQEARVLAHDLKSTAGTIGAKEVQEAARALEEALKQGESAAALEPRLQRVLSKLDPLLQALKQIQE